MRAYLDTIIAAHRARAADDHRDLDELMARADASAEPRPFTDA